MEGALGAVSFAYAVTYQHRPCVFDKVSRASAPLAAELVMASMLSLGCTTRRLDDDEGRRRDERGAVAMSFSLKAHDFARVTMRLGLPHDAAEVQGCGSVPRADLQAAGCLRVDSRYGGAIY